MSTQTQQQNRFENVIDEVESASSPSQRTERLIDGIAKQMSQTNNQQCQQFGQELQQARPRLLKALQQS